MGEVTRYGNDTVPGRLASSLLAYIRRPTPDTFAAVEKATASCNRLDRELARKREEIANG